MKSVVSLTLTLLCFIAQAQINSETIAIEIDSLYKLSKLSFDSILEESSFEEDGTKFFSATYWPTGGTNARVSIDEEDSRTYHVYFELVSLKFANEQLEELATAVASACEPFNLKRSKGTDVKYQNFQAIRIEYDSDNIDELGKHPSFTLGILKNSQPPTIEMLLNEPLWK